MKKMILLLMLVIPAVVFAQIGWTEYTIDDNFFTARSVYAIDLDGDGDTDVLGAAQGANDIAWWENDGASPPGFTKHTIDGNFSGAYCVYVIDLDNDNDIDVLGASDHGDDDITWWENDGANPPGFTKHTIDSDFSGAYCVYAIDLDNDNDIDVLGAASSADDITWWENDGASPPGFTKHTIAGNFDGAYCVYAIDLDNDNDIDVLGAAFNADDITWWENDGASPPSFTEHKIANFDGARSVYAIDLDNDNDIDVLGAASNPADDITWWENDGASPPGFTEHKIANFSGACCVYAIDLDNDNDIDVLGAAFNVDDITWWENDGASPPSFTKHTIAGNFDGAQSVYAIDLDGDEDIDVLGAAASAHDIVWWKSDLVRMDVGAVSIDIPSNLPEDTTLNPHATVVNLCPNSASFDVICEIEPGAYTSTATVTALAPDDSIQVTFPDIFTFVIGNYTVTVYTQLAGDENPTNDTLEKVVEAADTDVGPVSIDIPSTVPEDTSLNPQATITNFGSYTESFPVTCEIEPGGYTRNRTVNDLAPGDSIQITFFAEFTFESGTYTVIVYSRLADDENPANDTLEKIIETHDPGIADGSSDIPVSFSFSLKNNPVKGRAMFNLALPEAVWITLRIYDVSGRLIDNLIAGRKSAGYYEIPWTKDVSSGIFFYHLDSPWQQKIGKLVLLK